MRIHACSLLPRLKRVVKLPEDVAVLERLSKSLNTLTTDNDRDVAASARSVAEEFKSSSTAGARTGSDPAFEAADKAKEAEEAEMQAKEEEVNKHRSAGGRSSLLGRADAESKRRISGASYNLT